MQLLMQQPSWHWVMNESDAGRGAVRFSFLWSCCHSWSSVLQDLLLDHIPFNWAAAAVCIHLTWYPQLLEGALPSIHSLCFIPNGVTSGYEWVFGSAGPKCTAWTRPQSIVFPCNWKHQNIVSCRLKFRGWIERILKIIPYNTYVFNIIYAIYIMDLIVMVSILLQ